MLFRVTVIAQHHPFIPFRMTTFTSYASVFEFDTRIKIYNRGVAAIVDRIFNFHGMKARHIVMATLTELACARIEGNIFSRETTQSVVKSTRKTHGLSLCSLTWAIDPGHVAMTAYMSGVIRFYQKVVLSVISRVTCLASQSASVEHNAFVQ